MQEQDSRATAYTTLALGQDFRHEIEIKRSRFITVLGRADNEDTARRTGLTPAGTEWLDVPLP